MKPEDCTVGAAYNTMDAMEKLSQYYGKNCDEEMKKHANKAYYGFLVTLGASLVGALYTLFHHGAAQYCSGASDVYQKFSNVVEDCDKLEDEWYRVSHDKE